MMYQPDVIKGKMITFTALEVLPAEYGHQLMQLGRECNIWRNKCEERRAGPEVRELYIEAQKALAAFDKNMRRQFGIRISRPVFHAVGV